MSTYAIGDIQGCWRELQDLLELIRFNPNHDSLWLTGDLVNRGPQSLDVLRWAAAQGPSLHVVLGNHDLKLLGCSLGLDAAGNSSSFGEILAAPDKTHLLEWLLSQPLLVRGQNHHLMIHAGLKPSWSLDRAESLASEASAALGADPRKTLEAYFSRERPLSGDHPAHTLAVLTLTRMVNARGEPDFSQSGPPEKAPEGYEPWFASRPPDGTTLLFGHWAALGFYRSPGVVCVDSGCVWGRSLTAYRLEDEKVFQVSSYAD